MKTEEFKFRVGLKDNMNVRVYEYEVKGKKTRVKPCLRWLVGEKKARKAK